VRGTDRHRVRPRNRPALLRLQREIRGRRSGVTVVHQDSPDRHSVVAPIETLRGAKTISVDPIRHVTYLFQPECGPPDPNSPPPARGRGARGPVVASRFFAISH